MHPIITQGVDECSEVRIESVFGLIKCKILPPKKMLFPILPFQTKKLTFPLCRSCAEKLEDFCSHDDNGRALYGTWTSIEIHRALKHGYKMIAVYEIYHYENSKRFYH